jgi:hypothetical protein
LRIDDALSDASRSLIVSATKASPVEVSTTSARKRSRHHSWHQ